MMVVCSDRTFVRHAAVPVRNRVQHIGCVASISVVAMLGESLRAIGTAPASSKSWSLGTAASEGCSEADVVALFERSYTQLCRAIARMLRGDQAAAEEVVMDAFEILYVRRHRVRVETAAGYLWRVAINEARTAATRSVKEAQLIDVASRRGLFPSDLNHDTYLAADRSVELSHVRTLVDALPMNQRIAVVLRYYCDWADGEIAAAMKCPPVTVRSWLRRARKTLSEQLRREGEGR